MKDNGKNPKEKIHFPALYPLWIPVFVDVLGYSILTPLFPSIEWIFHVDVLTVSLLLSTNALFGFICGPLLGSLSDKHGRRPFLIVSEIGTLAGFILFAFAPSIEFLFLSRAVDGIFGGIYPITRAVIGDVVPHQYRSKQMANMGVIHILASLVGPSAGGVLVDLYKNLIAPGMLAVVLSAASIVITIIFFKETLPMKGNLPVEKDSEDFNHAHSNEQSHGDEDPISKNKTALFVLAQWGVHALYFIIFISLTSIYLDESLHLSSSSIGLFMSLSGIFRIVLRYTAFEPIINKFGDKKTAKIGLFAFMASFFALIFVQNWIEFLVVMIISSFAASLARGPMNSFMSRSVSKFKQGRMQGLGNSLEKIDEIVGPVLGGTVLDVLGAPSFGLLLFSISCIPFAMSFKKLTFKKEGLQEKDEMLEIDD
jgi:MFS transporter, DHA1 family, tetracycline resistance protein